MLLGVVFTVCNRHCSLTSCVYRLGTAGRHDAEACAGWQQRLSFSGWQLMPACIGRSNSIIFYIMSRLNTGLSRTDVAPAARPGRHGCPASCPSSQPHLCPNSLLLYAIARRSLRWRAAPPRVPSAAMLGLTGPRSFARLPPARCVAVMPHVTAYQHHEYCAYIASQHASGSNLKYEPIVGVRA